MLASTCINVCQLQGHFSEPVLLHVSVKGHIYHVVLRFAVCHHHSDAVLGLAGSVSGGEHVVHSEPDGPSGLRRQEECSDGLSK